MLSPILLCESKKILHTISVPIQDLETSSVLARNSSRNPEMQISSFPLVVQSMSLNIDMKMVQFFWDGNLGGSLEESSMTNNPGKISLSNSIDSPSILPILCQKAIS